MSRRVLLWCGEETPVQPLGAVLAELKLQVVRCTSSADTKERLREEHFDAIIFDLAEDESDAAEILRSARKSSLNRTILAITVVNGGANVRDHFSLGTNFLLFRPVTTERARASLRAASALMGRERRRKVRLPVHSKATIDSAGLENGQATLLDLSEEGTAIQSERKFPPSCKVYFKFELPEQAALVQLSAEVVWQDSTGRVGMRFVGVPQSSRRLLREWLGGAFEKAQVNLNRRPPSAPLARDSGSGPERDGQRDALNRLRASPGNRRGQSRRPCQVGAEVYKANSDVPHRCSLSDIGIGGCYVEMPSPFASGNQVEIQVRIRETKLRLPGVVLAVHPGFGMGVRFELRNADERKRLERLIEQLEGTAQGLEYGTPAGPR